MEPNQTIGPWGDDVPLRGPDAPKNNGQIKHLIECLLTVYKRFGNTAVTADLQWGATALHKRDEQKESIEELVTALRAAVDVAKAWHGDVAWDIYYAHSPEMKLVREALAKHPQEA